MELIHERLRYIRDRLGMTTRTFGKSINMTGGAITNMEKGTRNITERTINDICRVHHVRRDWLITGDGAPFKNDHELFFNSDIPDEVKELAIHYNSLSPKDKALVQNMIDSLYEKALLSAEKPAEKQDDD